MNKISFRKGPTLKMHSQKSGFYHSISYHLLMNSKRIYNTFVLEAYGRFYPIYKGEYPYINYGLKEQYTFDTWHWHDKPHKCNIMCRSLSMDKQMAINALLWKFNQDNEQTDIPQD